MGGSGGGQSGKVDYPDYMKSQHEEWMTEIDALIASAIAVNPYDVSGTPPYDPTNEGLDVLAAMAEFGDYLDTLDSSPGLDDEVDAYYALLMGKFEADTLPFFEAGMRDINAVQTSTFVMGKQALIMEVLRQTGQYEADLRSKYKLNVADLRHKLAVGIAEANRLFVVFKKEYVDERIEWQTAQVKWDLEMYNYGANMLAAIGGARASGQPGKPSRLQSALGGAMAGAATGAMVSGGNPYGAIAGAIIGGIGGYFA